MPACVRSVHSGGFRQSLRTMQGLHGIPEKELHGAEQSLKRYFFRSLGLLTGVFSFCIFFRRFASLVAGFRGVWLRFWDIVHHPSSTLIGVYSRGRPRSAINPNPTSGWNQLLLGPPGTAVAEPRACPVSFRERNATTIREEAPVIPETSRSWSRFRGRASGRT